MLIDAKRRWERSLPAYGRLDASVDIEDRRAPQFRELRVSAASFATDLWDGAAADGLVLVILWARVQRGRLIVDHMPIGAVSLHGLARRIERGRDRSDDAVFADLDRLGFSFPALVEAGQERFSVPVSSGQWAGSLVRLGGMPAALAQTYLRADGAAVSTPPRDLMALMERLPAMAVR